jgi:hypothetical protein
MAGRLLVQKDLSTNHPLDSENQCQRDSWMERLTERQKGRWLDRQKHLDRRKEVLKELPMEMRKAIDHCSHQTSKRKREGSILRTALSKIVFGSRIN